MSKFCVYCGSEMEDNDNACGNCGKLVSDEKVTIVNNVVTPVNQNKTEGTAIAGFVVSLVSMLCCGGTSTIGLILSIIGLVLCNKNNTKGKGFAIAGIVISSILFILLIVLYFVGTLTTVIDTYSSI